MWFLSHPSEKLFSKLRHHVVLRYELTSCHPRSASFPILVAKALLLFVFLGFVDRPIVWFDFCDLQSILDHLVLLVFPNHPEVDLQIKVFI